VQRGGVAANDDRLGRSSLLPPLTPGRGGDMAAEGCEGWDPSLSWRRGLLTTEGTGKGVSNELARGKQRTGRG
jgi:hypothetical protein